MQPALHWIYPPQCLMCDTRVTGDFALCPDCWKDTPFIHGGVCDCCGLPLLMENETDIALCDDCLHDPRPWGRGRAAMLYQNGARHLVMALKHGDRLDLVKPAAGWLARAAAPLLRENTIIAPVPLHWFRLLRRRYNQSALLARAMAKRIKAVSCPDLLIRRRYTPSQEGRGRAARFANMQGAIDINPRRRWLMQDRAILLVDDVMTSGATLSACARACLQAGAARVDVVVLCRVPKAE